MAEQNKRVTQWDVAKEAGVSRSQVSYVINGDTRYVSPETRKKILDAIDKLGYHTNQAAQKLRLGIDEYVKKQIGLIISNPEVFSNPFHSKIIASLHNAAHEKGCRIHFIRFFDELKDPVLFNSLVHPDEIGGLLLLDLSKQYKDDDNGILMEKIRSRMKNTVSIEWKTPLFPCVRFDVYKSGQIAVDYLFARGYTSIGYVGPVDERLSGIRDAMTENHQQVDGMFMAPAHTMEDGFKIAKSLIDSGQMPRAIICGSDDIASGMLFKFNQNKIDVPSTVALIGMGNTDITKYTNPSLTTMNIKLNEIGQTAIDMIIGGPYNHDSILPVEIIEGAST